MSAITPRPPLRILTSLRFFAAMEVVTFHVVHTPTSKLRSISFFYDLISAGYEAVTFFFILSGFILTYVYSGHGERDDLNVTVREFWRARIARVLPAYLLGLLLLLPPFLYGMLDSQVVPVNNLIISLILAPIFLQAWWPPVALMWNLPAWSVSVEWLFYVLFFPLARAMRLLSRNSFLLIGYLLVVARTVARIAIVSPPNIFDDSDFWANFSGYFPLLHLPQFIFGMALGRLFLFGKSVPPRIHVAMLWVGVISLVLVFGYRSLLPWWATDNVVLVPLFGLTIFGAARAEETFKALTVPTIVLLGEASYSIYILHIPLHFWWNLLLRNISGVSLSAGENISIYFGLVIIVSVLSFLYLETPLRRHILGHREHRSR